jgi:hypothetical protein
VEGALAALLLLLGFQNEEIITVDLLIDILLVLLDILLKLCGLEPLRLVAGLTVFTLFADIVPLEISAAKLHLITDWSAK